MDNKATNKRSREEQGRREDEGEEQAASSNHRRRRTIVAAGSSSKTSDAAAAAAAAAVRVEVDQKVAGPSSKTTVEKVANDASADVVWDNIVRFLDIPQLGICAQVSKTVHAAVMKDETWKTHLKKLLRKVFDGAFYIEPKEEGYWKNHKPVRLSKRPLKSTNFRLWYLDWNSQEQNFKHADGRPIFYDTFHKTAGKGRYVGRDGNEIAIDELTGTTEDGEFCRWLFEDVPLRTYYQEAAKFAYLGYLRDLQDAQEAQEERDLQESDDDDEDDYDSFYGDEYGGNQYDYDGVLLGLDHEIFQGLPNIRLFHGLGGYRRRRQFYDYYGDY